MTNQETTNQETTIVNTGQLSAIMVDNQITKDQVKN